MLDGASNLQESFNSVPGATSAVSSLSGVERRHAASGILVTDKNAVPPIFCLEESIENCFPVRCPPRMY
jgi:hypothetical protein